MYKSAGLWPSSLESVTSNVKADLDYKINACCSLIILQFNNGFIMHEAAVIKKKHTNITGLRCDANCALVSHVLERLFSPKNPC